MKRQLLLVLLIIAASPEIHSQCAPAPANIYSFTTNGTTYEIVKENLNWIDAAACAVFRGGKLAEINSQTEQDTLFYYMNLANINAANTIAPDGGGASYLWLGGNDLTSEGVWVWDGDNDGNSVQFWQGTTNGFPVGGLYNNWGNEPDDWNGQDCLGLAFTNWPLGVAGQWNDIDETNLLYYVIEYPNTTSVSENKIPDFSIYPNPAINFITVKVNPILMGSNYSIKDELGRIVLTGCITKEISSINITSISSGMYIFYVEGEHNQSFKVMKK
jgi:hypothetical protein